MKIVIADDERLVRVSIKSMIEEFGLPNCDILECRNGKETMEVIKALQPDIAFVDIKMPLLSGLQAIEESLTAAKGTEFVVITGFSEFEYAKKAIELGIYDYLLKPVKPEKLSEVISKIMEVKRNKLIEENTRFQTSILELYYDEDSVDETQCSSLCIGKSYSAISFYMDNELKVDETNMVKRKLTDRVRPIVEEMLVEGINVAKLNIGIDSTTYVFAYRPADYNRINKFVRRLMDQYEEVEGSGKLTTIMGNTLQSLKKINDEIKNIKRYSVLRIVLGIGADYSVDEFSGYKDNSGYYEICDILQDLSECWKNNIYIRFCNLLERLDRAVNSSRSVMQDRERFNNINNFLLRTMGFRYDGAFSIDWLNKLNEEKEKLLRSLSKTKDITDQIMDFIDTNYMYEVSMNSLSETFNLTPNYLSTLFHKRTNMKLVDYIAKVRITKAKNLLAETEMNISEICEAVGYHSSRYFTTLFKKLTGQLPFEYRKSMK